MGLSDAEDLQSEELSSEPVEPTDQGGVSGDQDWGSLLWSRDTRARVQVSVSSGDT